MSQKREGESEPGGRLKGWRVPQRLEGVSETGWRLRVWKTPENIGSAEHWVSGK